MKRTCNSCESKTHLQLLCILLLGFIAYSNTFNVPFVLDDLDLIVENPAMDNLSVFFGSADWSAHAIRSRWVALASLAFNRGIDGLDETGFHVVNLLIHLITGALVYFITAVTLTSFGDASKKRYAAAPLLAALVFVLHPVQTQAVTYIVQRMASLATLFYLAALLFYAKTFLFRPAPGDSPRIRQAVPYLGALLSCLLSMSTKEISFTLPLMLVLFDICFLEGTARQRLVRLSPFLVCMALMPLYFFGAGGMPHGDGNPNTATLPHSTYIMTQLRVLVTYLRLLILPVGQNLDYDYPLYTSLLQPQAAASFILLISLFIGGIMSVKRSFRKPFRTPVLLRISGFAIIWFFITLSVESGAVPLQDVIFEHRLYLPSVWFCITLGVAIAELRQRAGLRQSLVTLAAVAVLITLGSATYLRNEVWGDERTLWEDVIKKSPNKARGWAALGAYHIDLLDPETAIPLLEQALKFNPGYYPVLFNLGLAAVQTGDPLRGLNLYLLATTIAPECSKGWELAGRLLLDMGKNAEAVFFLRRAQELDPARFASEEYLRNAITRGAL